MRVDEHTIEVAGTPVFYRSAPVPSHISTPLYLHGIPTSSDDWIPFLERTGGIAPDLVGFGRSGKGGHLDFTVQGQTGFLERLLDELNIERVRLVAHDWGAAGGLVLAQRNPARVERLVLCDALPLLERFAWRRLARMIRRPGIGELIMGSTPRWLLARELRSGCVNPEAFSEDRVSAVWGQFDQGTQRAILRLHRSAREADLATAGAKLETLRMPALVVWGEQDPWLPAEFADAYARRVPLATVIRVADAGHWPWLDAPEVLERIADFVAE